MTNHPRLIIGMSGSSGIIYGIRLLEILKQMPIETHLVVSKAAQLALAYESDLTLAQIKKLAGVYHAHTNIAAPIASGSFKTIGMIVAPCSMNSLAEMAHGISNNLLARAADVTLKERRRLVIMPREAPLHEGHLNNMLSLTKIGGIIFPPVPAFYQAPRTIDDLVNDTVSRVLALFDIDSPYLTPWEGTKP